MKNKWIFHSAMRYFNSKISIGRHIIILISVIVMALGISSLILILGIMNGLQKGYIDTILEVSSSHIRIETDSKLSESSLNQIGKIDNIKSIILGKEIQTVIFENGSLKNGYILRAFDKNEILNDKTIIKKLKIIRGSFNLDDNNILVSRNFSIYNGAYVGSEVELISISDKNFNILKPKAKKFIVSGVYETGFSDIDNMFIFANVNMFSSVNVPYTYFVKLNNRYNDLITTSNLKEIINNDNCKITSWRDYNKSFFSALFIEKVAMTFLLCIIIFIVALNIYYMFKRLVYEKREDISILRSLGATPNNIKSVYLLLGLYIGFFGTTLGLVFGLLIAVNFNSIISSLDFICQTLFSAYFYINFSFYYDLPIILVFKEIFCIYIFGVLSTLIAAFFSCKKLSEIKPSEVLRYE